MIRMKASPPVRKFIKKDLKKSTPLKTHLEEACRNILAKPLTAGEPKKWDLSGVNTYDFRFAKTEYRIAYILKEDQEGGEYVLFILAGTHENFYMNLKNYW